MSWTSANICSGAYGTSALRVTSFMRPGQLAWREFTRVPATIHDLYEPEEPRQRQPDDRRESQGASRLFHRGNLRGRPVAAGLGSEEPACRARAAEGSVRLREGRGGLPVRRPRLGAADCLDARHPGPDPYSQASAEPLRAEPPGRRGRAPRLHARAAGAVLEERPRQAAHRPGEGQEGARQARQREGSRLAAGEVPLDETLDEMKKAAGRTL